MKHHLTRCHLTKWQADKMTLRHFLYLRHDRDHEQNDDEQPVEEYRLRQRHCHRRRRRRRRQRLQDLQKYGTLFIKTVYNLEYP